MIDLRRNEDTSIYSHGRRILNTQAEALLELTKSGATIRDHRVYVFVISDALVNFVNNDLQSIQY